MDEKLKRLWAGAEAAVLDKDGVDEVADATGLSVKTIRTGIRELKQPWTTQLLQTSQGNRVRKVGGGRKRLEQTAPTLRGELEALIDQKLANETGLKIKVAHFPPGTSKWNKIEHRLFCHITENWRSRPLTSREVVVNLIGSTTTKKGLSVKAQLDETKYEIGKKVSDEDLSKVNIEPASFHGEWNYSVLPNTP